MGIDRERARVVPAFAAFFLVAVGAGCAYGAPPRAFSISSDAIVEGGAIPRTYTCDGQNVNPRLSWIGVPPGTASLALVVHDPDASSGDWTHWLMWNLPPDSEGILQDSVPEGAIMGTTDFGSPLWNGPCPPSGTHRYRFDLYALDTTLDLPRFSRSPELMIAIRNHVISEASLVGTYARAE